VAAPVPKAAAVDVFLVGEEEVVASGVVPVLRGGAHDPDPPDHHLVRLARARQRGVAARLTNTTAGRVPCARYRACARLQPHTYGNQSRAVRSTSVRGRCRERDGAKPALTGRNVTPDSQSATDLAQRSSARLRSPYTRTAHGGCAPGYTRSASTKGKRMPSERSGRPSESARDLLYATDVDTNALLFAPRDRAGPHRRDRPAGPRVPRHPVECGPNRSST
jgi:hypothetical protein